MAVLRESPWYREILEEGLALGRQEGLEEGRRQERLDLLLEFLAYRFQLAPKRIKARLAARSLPELKTLFNAAMDVDSLAAFEAQLAAIEQEQG